jgi:hypothetical protein
LRLAIVIIGITIACLGIIGVVAPSLLLDLGISLLTENGLYVVAALRVAFGLLLLFGARLSRMPQTLRVIGVVIIIAGFVAPLFGVERSAAVLDSIASHGPLFVRVAAMIAIAFGAFVVYAVTSRRHSAG